MNVNMSLKAGATSGIVLTLLVLTFSACASNRGLKASLDREFSLAIGQTVQISGEDLGIRLTDVIGDSRCPEGANCIVAGEVTCVLDVTLNGKNESYRLVVPGTGGAGDHTYRDYALSANVEPYPKLGVEIDKTEYRMKMTVSKTNPSGMDIQPAPIHEVDIRFAKSLPVQVSVYIRGGLRDGCTTFKESSTTRKNTVIEIDVLVQRPWDKVCPAIYGYFEQTVELGSDFVRGETYTVKVNDVTKTFVAP
jgi:hypothetical protein